MKNLLSRFERLPLSSKFFFVFSIIGGSAVIVALSVGFSLYTISQYNAASDHAVRKVQLITAIQFNTSLVWQYMTDASLTKDHTVITREAAPAKKKAMEDLEQLLALPGLTENERRDYTAIGTGLSGMFELGTRMVRAYSSDKRFGDQLMRQFDTQMTGTLSLLTSSVAHENAGLKSHLIERERLLWGVIIAVGFTSLLLIAMTVFLSRWLTRYILTPIRKITELSQRVAEGEFVYRITGITEKDELGSTCWEFNDMVDQIEALLKEIITSIEYAGQGKYFRKPLSVGLRGLLGRAAVQVERSLKEQELRMRSIEEDKKYLSLKTNEMLYAMEKFAEGDLTVMVHAEKEDEIKKLFDGFNRSIANLNQRLLEVNEAAERATEAGSTISSSTTQMAAGAEEQSAQTGEVASAMEEMSKTISENAHSAQLAVQTAIQARHAAQNGGTLVENTVNGMERITEVVKHSAVTINALGKSSSQIGEIVGVINDIADQTNLLALNAAIEAARAGEQGRGFAVVADEVRKLAERTTKATKEISVMIRRIQEDTKEAVAGIEEGTKNVEEERQLAAKAGASLKEIVSIVNTVTEMISTIATANAEQAKAGEDISRNIVGISAVTNENTHAIDQISRSAEQVAQITANLQGLVGSFTLDLSKDPAHRSDVVVQPNGTLTKKKTVNRVAHQSI